MVNQREAKVCIVGSGVAGGLVAQELLNAGQTGILMIEAGPKPLVQDRSAWYDYLNDLRDPLSDTHRLKEETDYEQRGKDHYSPTMLAARGGSTLRWTGYAPRLKPEDFELRSRTGHGADWPISYDDLEPFYAQAERSLQVSGDASDAGHPPRSGAFPLPPFPFAHSDEPYLQAMNELGYSVQHSVIARNTKPINDMPQCQTIGTCGYCPIGGRFTGNQLMDHLAARDGFELLVGHPVSKILFDEKRRAVGVLAIDSSSGEEVRIEADRVVIAGGGLGSPKLLLQSAGSPWPEGVGNDTGLVGRFLHSHWTVASTGAVANPQGFYQEVSEIVTLVSRHFDSPGFQKDGKFGIGMFQYRYPPFDLIDLMSAGKTTEEIRAELSEMLYIVFNTMLEEFPVRHNGIRLGTETDRFGLPKLLVEHTHSPELIASGKRALGVAHEVLEHMGCTTPGFLHPGLQSNHAHHLGTCRMGASAQDSVVDANLKVHGTDNLYVCSSAVFPSGGAAQPTLTIAALAHRLGRHLSATQ